jgi:hypothetical protein
MPAGSAMPTRFRDMAPPGAALASITAAASAYGTIISGTRDTNSASNSREGENRAKAGIGDGTRSKEIRKRSRPIRDCSTIGPGQSGRQSRSGQVVHRQREEGEQRRPTVIITGRSR